MKAEATEDAVDAQTKAKAAVKKAIVIGKLGGLVRSFTGGGKNFGGMSPNKSDSAVDLSASMNGVNGEELSSSTKNAFKSSNDVIRERKKKVSAAQA